MVVVGLLVWSVAAAVAPTGAVGDRLLDHAPLRRLARQPLAPGTSRGRPGGRHPPLEGDSATPCRPPGDLRRRQDQEAPAAWFTVKASSAARIFCLHAACQLGRSARHRQHAGRSSMSRPRASTRSTCEVGRSEGSGDRAFLDGRLRSPFGSSQAEELNGELPHRPRGSECGGRAHLGLWMPQTGRLPSVAITCRAGSNAA